MCVHGRPSPGTPWKGGRDIWGPGLHRSWFNYRFSAAGRWAHVGKEGERLRTLSFSYVCGPLRRGASRHFLRKPQSGLSWPQHEHNDRCILQQAGSEWVRPACLLSDESLFSFFFSCHLLTVWVSCISLFFLLFPLPGKMARYLRDPSGDRPLPHSFRHRGLHHGSGSAQNQTEPGLEIRRAGVHGCVGAAAGPSPPTARARKVQVEGGRVGTGHEEVRWGGPDPPCSRATHQPPRGLLGPATCSLCDSSMAKDATRVVPRATDLYPARASASHCVGT